MRAGGEARTTAVASAVYAAATAAFLLPAIGGGGRVGPGLGDPLLNLCFLEWGAHRLASGLGGLWSPPFFFPTPRVLTLSDHLLGPAAAHLALRSLGLSPASSYGALVAATFALGGAAAYLVLRRTGLSFAGALAGGWVFAFSGFHWSVIGHYQAARMQWIPLVLFAFDRLLERASGGRAAVFVAAYALHVSGGAYLAQLVHLPLLVLLVNRWAAGGGRFATTARLRVWAAAAAGALAVAGALYLPYLDSPVGLGDRRDPAEVLANGASLASLATPSALSLESRLAPFLPRDSGRGAFFPGIAALALAAGALAGPGRARLREPWPRGLLLSGAVMLVLCFGPAFAAASAVVPGMAAMRVPTRAFAFVGFPLALLAGLGAERLAARARTAAPWRAVAVATALALAVEAAPALGPWTEVPAPAEFPAYAGWIAAHDEVDAYLELPLAGEPAGEAIPMYLQTRHWRPMANGYSAVVPASFVEIRSLCRPFPDAVGLERLRAIGVTHVVVRWRRLAWEPGPPERARVSRFREGFVQALDDAGARCVFADDTAEVYALAVPRRLASAPGATAASAETGR